MCSLARRRVGLCEGQFRKGWEGKWKAVLEDGGLREGGLEEG